MWSESKVSSQTLLSCLRKATEEKVKERLKKERERRKEGKISPCLSAGSRPQGR